VRLRRLLAWMAGQEFADLAQGEPSILRQVEAIVVDAHRGVYERAGKVWSRPAAYHWLRYEDPMPVARLAEGVEKLEMMGATFDADAVEKACIEAAKRGFSY